MAAENREVLGGHQFFVEIPRSSKFLSQWVNDRYADPQLFAGFNAWRWMLSGGACAKVKPVHALKQLVLLLPRRGGALFN